MGSISGKEVVYTAIGFMMVALLTPIGMAYVAGTNTTFNVTGTAATWTTSYTLFTVLLPILYLVGVGLYFLPRFKHG